jgi:hypothetical protein
MILDAGVLVSVDRHERSSTRLLAYANWGTYPIHTSEAVVAQVWRDGGRQARLAGFLHGVEIHPLDDGRGIGRLLRDAGTSDVVDAHVALLGLRLRDEIVTGDVDDLRRLTAPMRRPPTIVPWPPPR